MRMYTMILWFLLFGESLIAQDIAEHAGYPEVDKPCPEFLVRNIKYYPKKEASLQDFKGKWLVLDFWNKACGACVASFPEVSSLQKEFGDKVQFMLVAIQDRQKQIEPMYAKFKEKENLIMPCAFDSTLAHHWDIAAAPHIIVIDDKGFVRGITFRLTRSDIQGFLSGTPPSLINPFRYDWEKDTRVAFDPKRPFLVNGNGGIDSSFLFRSLLSAFDGARQPDFIPPTITADSSNGKFQVLGANIFSLYNYAWYGTPWPDSGYNFQSVLEVSDSAVFDYSSANNHNLFCYSLSLPPSRATGQRMQKTMQRDLEIYFGYKAAIETRAFPCWRLVATEQAKKRLKTKGGKESFKSIIPKADFDAHNWPFSNFLHLLRIYSDYDIIDDTGITGNIDIGLNCLLADTNALKANLQIHGLDLIPDTKVKKVLVIRDNL